MPLSTSLTSSLATLSLSHSLGSNPFLLFDHAMPGLALGYRHKLKDVTMVVTWFQICFIYFLFDAILIAFIIFRKLFNIQKVLNKSFSK